MQNKLLALLQGKLQKNAEGKVVVLNGGVEQDLKRISQVSKILEVDGNIILSQVVLLVWVQSLVLYQMYWWR